MNKRTFFYPLLMVIALFAVSCKKAGSYAPASSTGSGSGAGSGSGSGAGSNTGYYIKFKKGSEWLTYNTNAVGSVTADNTPGNQSIAIEAIGNSSDLKNVISFTIIIPGATQLSTGNYDDNNSDYEIYFANLSNPAAPIIYDNSDAPNQAAASKYSFKITEVTQTGFKGTFAGNYLYDALSGAGILNITEGEFNVKKL
jgi:hypothetical protein